MPGRSVAFAGDARDELADAGEDAADDERLPVAGQCSLQQVIRLLQLPFPAEKRRP